jgi:hypothetical protein
MAEQRTARQHYVPQGFLRGFAAPDEQSRNMIWAYEKLSERKPRKVSIRSIAWEEGYYAQEHEDGSDDLDTIEKGLAHTVDQPAAEIIRRIDARPGQMVRFTGDEKGLLAFFIGISLTRVPSFREPMLRFHSNIAQMTLESLAETDEYVRQGMERWGVKASAKDWATLRPMVAVGRQIGESILQKQWQFSIPPEGISLVTSDNPVLMSTGLRPNPFMGPAHPNTEIVMNLRSDLALVCTPKTGYSSGMVFAQSVQDTKKFNRGIVRAARRFVFANFGSDTLDKFVKKYSHEEQTIRID